MNTNTQTTETLPAAAVDVRLVGDVPKTTSLNIAEVFGKQHKDVLKVIKNLYCSEEFRQRNFEPTFYQVAGPNGATRQESCYQVTKNGTVMLAMGFTGREAMRFKEAYIAEFDRLEAMAHAGGGLREEGGREPTDAKLREAWREEHDRRVYYMIESVQLRNELLGIYRQLYGKKH